VIKENIQPSVERLEWNSESPYLQENQGIDSHQAQAKLPLILQAAARGTVYQNQNEEHKQRKIN